MYYHTALLRIFLSSVCLSVCLLVSPHDQDNITARQGQEGRGGKKSTRSDGPDTVLGCDY